MTNNQLVIFNAVVNQGSFKKASESLFKSQSALSLAIKNLEEELGFNLFSRAGYRPELTTKGRTFYQKSALIAEQFKELEVFGRELASFNDPLVSISIDNIFPMDEMERVFKTFRSESPLTKIKLQSDILDGGIEKLIDKTVDFSIVPNFLLDSTMEYQKISTIEFVSVLAPEMMKQIKDAATDLLTLPQIIINSSAKKPKDFTVGVQDQGHHWFVSDQALKKELLLRGMGWGNMPVHQIVDEIEHQKLMPLDAYRSRSYIDLYLVKLKEKALGKNARRLWELFSI